MEKNNQIHFYKMTGGGNDFVLFDNRENVLPKDYGTLAKKLCSRKFSIGADGLLILENADGSHFRMVYYNADGSRAEMCGNGARCIARFAYALQIAPETMRFLTDAGPLDATVQDETVKLRMGAPKDLKLDFPLKLEEGKEIHISSVNTGVPHVVLLVTDIEKMDVDHLGRTIRYHKQFAPRGTNVNFVARKDPHTLLVRTYERGVESETLACGTGVVASALIGAVKGLVTSPVSCLTRGGETLKIYFTLKSQTHSFSEVYLEGPAQICFVGEVEI
ncbi:MAG: diaminopimelate epimerase [Elusimicrobia bacterium]|nr:diaminopimelate epimerase [Elusimicrobiota bacterium]